jgi:hypothetical protein
VGVIAVMRDAGRFHRAGELGQVRTDASYLANQITGTMWTDMTNLTTYATAGSAGRVAWDATVAATLPSGTATITVVGSLVTVTVNWQAPNESVVRKYVSAVNINPTYP